MVLTSCSGDTMHFTSAQRYAPYTVCFCKTFMVPMGVVLDKKASTLKGKLSTEWLTDEVEYIHKVKPHPSDIHRTPSP